VWHDLFIPKRRKKEGKERNKILSFSFLLEVCVLPSKVFLVPSLGKRGIEKRRKEKDSPLQEMEKGGKAEC